MAKGAYIGVGGVAKKIKKGYIGVENFVPRSLPSGYTQVEYIQSSGTQYIDTGFKPNNNSRVVMDVQAGEFNNRWLLGSRTSATSDSFAVALMSTSTLHSEFGAANTTATVSKATERTTVDKNKNVCLFGSVAVTNTAASFSGAYPIYLLSLNNGGTAASKGFVGKLYSCRIYDNGTLIRDYVPCKNASGTVGLYDLAKGSFYTNAGTGTFTAGATYSSVARKIKKAFIGIGGVARPCWSGGELAYYGKTTETLRAKQRLVAATSVGDYAVFAGGTNDYSAEDSSFSAYIPYVTAYNSSLVRSAPTNLRYAASMMAAASVGDYALFAGGRYYNTDISWYTSRATVNAYNKTLTRSSPADLYNAADNFCGARVGNYAVFAFGYCYSTSGSGGATNAYTAYNASLTRSYGTHGSGRSSTAAASVGNYAIFTGGSYAGTYYSDAYTFNASLTKSTATSLSLGRARHSATSVGDYALFAGGEKSSAVVTNAVDVYNASLTRTVAAPLTGTGIFSGTYDMAATTLGNYAIFAGGRQSPTTVQWYDASLTQATGFSLSDGRYAHGATTIGNYALFGGGNNPSSASTIYNTVEAFTID